MPIDVDEGEDHHAQVGEIGARAVAEAELDPLGAGERRSSAAARR